jgi:hypothetical protein
MILTMFWTKNRRKYWRFLFNDTASFDKHWFIALVFQKKRQFVRRKLAKIAKSGAQIELTRTTLCTCFK